VREEYETYLMIRDIEQKEKEAENASWFVRLFKRKP
jgi:hypothetical protein